MKSWQVGDRAIYDCPDSSGGAHGLEVIILTSLMSLKINGTARTLAHRFDPGFPHPLKAHWANTPDHFKPIPDNGSWSELEKTLQWNPTKLVTVENK